MKIKHGNFQYPGDSQLFPISLDDDDGQMELQINLYIYIKINFHRQNSMNQKPGFERAAIT